MELTYILLAIALGTFAWFFMKPMKKSENNLSFPIESTEPEPTESEPTEIIKIDDPVPNDPEPEMPIKPTPIDCQYAIFRPAPEMYSYTDCCGNLQQGEGFQPWEKRSPVAIDITKDFIGMDLISEDAIVDC